MKAVLTRYYQDDNQTLGLFKINNVIHTPVFTIERPWKDNKSDVSCIPIGTYDVTFLSTPKFPSGVYQLQNVPGRVGIDIHAANKASELEGCIAVGSAVYCLDGEAYMVANSGSALRQLLVILAKNLWQLNIRNL